MKIIRKPVEYQSETSLKNRNIYRTTDQTNRANSTPAIIIRLIVIILSSTGKQSNLISFPDYSCYTSLHHRVNTASRFRQTLKNNQNFWAHCRLIICHNLLAPLAEITHITRNTQKNPSVQSAKRGGVSLSSPLSFFFLPPHSLSHNSLVHFCRERSFFSGNRRELTLSGLSYNRNINEYVATL